jgi:type I restriction enzyme S subunit
MKKAIIRSTWIDDYGYRLDCSPYLGGALETKLLLEKLPLRKDSLHTLTAGFEGGIYNGPQFVRNYVESEEYGVRFMTGSSMLLADLSRLPLLSMRDARGPKLRHLEIQPGMTLISCSGTIGKMAYARPEMAGTWSSQDILKVVPDAAKIPPGYLYAYLSSKFGVPLVVSGTYGAIIQHLEPVHICRLPVPRLGDALEHEIHALVEQAAELRSKAAEEIKRTTESVHSFLRLPELKHKDVRGAGVTTIRSWALNLRLDATYHSPAAVEADAALRSCAAEPRRLADVTKRLFKPPMFKRLWVDAARAGAQFISGNDAYKFKSDDVRYVSRRTPNFDQFILHEGWLVFQAAGQIYGLFARPLFVYGWLDHLFCADDMYRIVPHEPQDGAYLFAFFRTKVGEILIKRQSAGNSIPRVWDPQMNQVVVPWPDKKQRQQFGSGVIKAHEKQFSALRSEEKAIELVESTIAKHG